MVLKKFFWAVFGIGDKERIKLLTKNIRAYILVCMKNNTHFSKKQIEAIKHIRNWLSHKGRTPSIRELMRVLNYKSPKSAQDIIGQLNLKGVIKKNKSGSYRFLSDPNLGPAHARTINIPLVGNVSCGEPILADQNIEGFIPVSSGYIKPGIQYFLLRVSGDSMNSVEINDGDLVLVRQQPTAEENEKVVALIDDEATIKEFHRTKDAIILKPKSLNKKHKPIILTNDFQIQGIVVATIPDLGK